ncbi:hypothetical protein H8959_005099, partial [Pygathrix nigripes]
MNGQAYVGSAVITDETSVVSSPPPYTAYAAPAPEQAYGYGPYSGAYPPGTQVVYAANGQAYAVPYQYPYAGLYGQQPANQVIIRERYRDNDSDLALGMLAGAATGMALGHAEDDALLSLVVLLPLPCEQPELLPPLWSQIGLMGQSLHSCPSGAPCHGRQWEHCLPYSKADRDELPPGAVPGEPAAPPDPPLRCHQNDSSQTGSSPKGSELGAPVQHPRQALPPSFTSLSEARTALHLASASGNSEVVKLLLDRRCQLNVLDNKNRTALTKAIQCQEDECALMLLEHGTDPNIPDEYGNTALHYAVYNEDKLMAKALLLYGAAIESKNKHGLTPLLLGVHEQKQQVVKFLIKKKANLNALDRYRRTALILAVCCGSASIVSLLLEQNIDVSSQDLSGQTAREYAVSSHHNVICQLFSDYKEKRMLKISSENSNPGKTCDTLFPVCPFSGITELLTSQKYSKQINLLFLHLQKMSEEPEINKDCDREVEEVKKHGSNHVGLPENLADGAAAGNGDDGLIPQSKSRTPGSQQFPDTENEECH